MANIGGTAFPIDLEITLLFCPEKQNQSGKVWILAASWGVNGRPGLDEGCVNLPCPFEPKPTVIVDAGSSHFILP